MSIRNIISVAAFLLIIVAFTGCDIEDFRPSYQEIENIVSSGEIMME